MADSSRSHCAKRSSIARRNSLKANSCHTWPNENELIQRRCAGPQFAVPAYRTAWASKNDFNAWRARLSASRAPAHTRARSRNASSSTVGTCTALRSPARSERTSLTASRRSVFTRSPARRGISEGAHHALEAFGREAALQVVAQRTGFINEFYVASLGLKLFAQPINIACARADLAEHFDFAVAQRVGDCDRVFVNIESDK